MRGFRYFALGFWVAASLLNAKEIGLNPTLQKYIDSLSGTQQLVSLNKEFEDSENPWSGSGVKETKMHVDQAAGTLEIESIIQSKASLPEKDTDFESQTEKMTFSLAVPQRLLAMNIEIKFKRKNEQGQWEEKSNLTQLTLDAKSKNNYSYIVRVNKEGEESITSLVAPIGIIPKIEDNFYPGLWLLKNPKIGQSISRKEWSLSGQEWTDHLYTLEGIEGEGSNKVFRVAAVEQARSVENGVVHPGASDKIIGFYNNKGLLLHSQNGLGDVYSKTFDPTDLAELNYAGGLQYVMHPKKFAEVAKEHNGVVDVEVRSFFEIPESSSQTVLSREGDKSIVRIKIDVRPEITDPVTDANKISTDAERLSPGLMKELQKRIKGKSDMEKVKIIFAMAKEKIEFVQSHCSAITAKEIEWKKTGDCTEVSVFVTALAKAAGLPARQVIGGAMFDPQKYDPAQPRRYTSLHLWSEIHVGNKWISVDPALQADPAKFDELASDHYYLKLATFNPLLERGTEAELQRLNVGKNIYLEVPSAQAQMNPKDPKLTPEH